MVRRLYARAEAAGKEPDEALPDTYKGGSSSLVDFSGFRRTPAPLS